MKTMKVWFRRRPFLALASFCFAVLIAGYAVSVYAETISHAVVFDAAVDATHSNNLRLESVTFYADDIAANLTSQLMGMDPSGDASYGGSIFSGFPVPYPGSIVGIAITSDVAITDGFLHVEATLGGPPVIGGRHDTGLCVGLELGGNTAFAHDTISRGQINFGPCDEIPLGGDAGIIGCNLTTSSTLTPSTMDITVTIWFVVDERI